MRASASSTGAVRADTGSGPGVGDETVGAALVFPAGDGTGAPFCGVGALGGVAEAGAVFAGRGSAGGMSGEAAPVSRAGGLVKAGGADGIGGAVAASSGKAATGRVGGGIAGGAALSGSFANGRATRLSGGSGWSARDGDVATTGSATGAGDPFSIRATPVAATSRRLARIPNVIVRRVRARAEERFSRMDTHQTQITPLNTT